MIGLWVIGKIWVNVPIQYFEIDNETIWVNVPIQYFEIYNLCGYNFLYSNSWFVLPRPTVNTTALVLNWKWLPLFQFLICSETHAPVLNWKWLPLFQFLICSETHALVFNWKWLGFKSLGKFEQMYPLNTLKFTIRKFEWMVPIQYFEIYNLCGYNFLYSISWFVLPRTAMNTTALVLNWKWLPLFQFLICSETHTLVLNWKWFFSNHWENLSECTHSIFWNLQSVWVQFPLFQFLICSGHHKLDLVQAFAKACHEYHSSTLGL